MATSIDHHRHRHRPDNRPDHRPRHRPRADSTHLATIAPLRSPWRWPAALALLVTGAVHIPVTPEHLEEAPYIGLLFAALTMACLVLAIAVLAFDVPAVWLLSGSVSGAAVFAYLLSRTVALPQIGDDVGHWFEPLGMAAISAETLTAVIAASILFRHRQGRTTP
jgi:hypothetical protein